MGKQQETAAERSAEALVHPRLNGQGALAQGPVNSCQARWPNLFMVGAARAGTTSIYHWLAAQDGVFLSLLKEPHFFSDFHLEPEWQRFHNIVRDDAAYLRLFRGAGSSRLLGEGSTSYLLDREAPRRIHAVNPDARVIAVLRDPVDRAYSHYLSDVREGIEKRPFATALEEEIRFPDRAAWPNLYVRYGLYAEGLRRYFELFGPSVHVLFFEELVARPEVALGAILEFLGLDTGVRADQLRPENVYARPRGGVGRMLLGQPRARVLARTLIPPRVRPALHRILLRHDQKPPMDQRCIRVLSRVYRREVPLLRDLLGREIPWAERMLST